MTDQPTVDPSTPQEPVMKEVTPEAPKFNDQEEENRKQTELQAAREEHNRRRTEGPRES